MITDLSGSINNSITTDILNNVKDISNELSSYKSSQIFSNSQLQSELMNMKDTINKLNTDISNSLVVKLVDNADKMNSEEEDPDIFYLDRNDSHLSVANWIYEFISLSVPLQHICKLDEKGKSTCNQKVIDQLNFFNENTPTDATSKTLWKGLDQFKDLDGND